MTTREAAAHLSQAAQQFPFLGEVTEASLLELMHNELGDAEILDRFRPYGSHFSKAIAPDVILHVISGNTPLAGLQSLIRGLLLQSHNLCKIPSAGLHEIEAFQSALPSEMAQKVEISKSLPQQWLDRADAVIVFGRDDTIEELRRRTRPDQRFVGHGHKISLGIIFDDPDYASVPHAASDASLFDQQGCLSPHGFYVREDAQLSAAIYAEKLAAAMEDFCKKMPRRELLPQETAALAQWRKKFEFLAANEPGIRVWHRAGWTVVYEENPKFFASPLNRFVFVKPLAQPLKEILSPVAAHLGAIGIWPATSEHAAAVADFGASRICGLGKMQMPPLTWHQEGGENLAQLVRWVDFEPSP